MSVSWKNTADWEKGTNRITVFTHETQTFYSHGGVNDLEGMDKWIEQRILEEATYRNQHADVIYAGNIDEIIQIRTAHMSDNEVMFAVTCRTFRHVDGIVS